MSQLERSENRKAANMQEAGKVLRELRGRTSLSLHDMSALSGKDVSVLSRAERGLCRTSDEVLNGYFEAARLDIHERTYNETVIKLMWGQAPRNLSLEEIKEFVEALGASRAERYRDLQ